MPNIRIFGGPLNETDVDVDAVPRIGERIEVTGGAAAESVKPHYLRVHDVIHKVGNAPGSRIAVLVVEEDEAKLWHQ